MSQSALSAIEGAGSPVCDFGDGCPNAQETLVAWAALPFSEAGDTQRVTFATALREPGSYRIRLMLAGSSVAAGSPCSVRVRHVEAAVRAPARVLAGEGVSFRFAFGFSRKRHTADVWAGLFVVPPQAGSHWSGLATAVAMAELGPSRRDTRAATAAASNARSGGAAEDDASASAAAAAGGAGQPPLLSGRRPYLESPYDPTRPVAAVSLGSRSQGRARFRAHPLYPGTYQIRVFGSCDETVCVTRSPPIACVAPLSRSVSHPHAHLLRELRVNLAAPTSGTRLDRESLARAVAPRLREIAEERCVAFLLVDVRQGVDEPADSGESGPMTADQLPHAAKRPGLIGRHRDADDAAGFASAAATAAARISRRAGGKLSSSRVDRTMDASDLAEVALLEAEACRPFTMALLTQSYGWVPHEWHPWVSWASPWLAHFTNDALPRVDTRSRVRRHPLRDRRAGLRGGRLGSACRWRGRRSSAPSCPVSRS
ncbi:hypothetical protein FNF28_06617 [Cafeteria roenbergensis]|uniref:Uncharacterized protein n=1 Tax=Cafeteria roenbergensis TaxID=33653 RepID=A0A5A8CV15_CAFRO|nr:hypothetical protein FNF28_06617 [Cafeteria roenbergensis]